MADILAFTARTSTAHRPSKDGASILPLGQLAELQARQAINLLLAAQNRVEGWNAHLARRRAEAGAAKSAARRMTGLTGAGDLSTALHSRAFKMGLACSRESLDRIRAVQDLHAAQRAAGAALAQLTRCEARRVYGNAFPDLTPQRVGTAVSALLRDHRAVLRFAREPL